MLCFLQILSVAPNHDDAIADEGLKQSQLVHSDIELIFNVETDLTQESVH